MKVVYTPAHLLHDPHVEFETSQVHSPFEHIGRAEAIRETLQADSRFQFLTPGEWGTAPIEAVHNPGLVTFLAEGWALYEAQHPGVREVVPDVFYRPALRDKMSQGREPQAINGRVGYWCFETTTPLTETTYQAARGAVDTALTTAQLVLDGESSAYGLCRPPGHHATADLYGGYCFFNNAAVAAHHVAATTGAKVTILDVDYHHGNGSQSLFEARADVLYVSLHGDPATEYPFFLGHADETGVGEGAGYTLNLPMPAGTDAATWFAALETACARVLEVGAEALVVSLGLDAYEGDPISRFGLRTADFGRLGARLSGLGLPTLFVLEGGYATAQLGRNALAVLDGFERT